MCACRTYRWTEERRADVENAIRSSRTRREAADKLGTTRDGLSHAGRVYGWVVGAMLGTAVRVAPAAPPPAVDPVPPPVEWTGARPASTGTGVERRLILSDTHFPNHLLSACAAVIALARAVQPHVILHLGDAWNMGAVSRHPRPFGGRDNHQRGQVQGLSFLDALGRAAPGARRVLLLGNHDDWALEFEDEHPEFAGMFAAKWMGLDRLGWETIARDQQPFILGPVSYAHGLGGGEHYAKRYALHETGARVHVRGHHHSMQHFRAKNGAECWGAGCLVDSTSHAFDYAKERGHWEVGCLVQDVFGDHVTTTPVRIQNGAALFGGRLISQERAA